MNNGLIPVDFSGCESEELGKELYSISNSNNLYDEIRHKNYGWFALVNHHKRLYIIWITPNSKFNYHYYGTQHAAKKAWDHVCTKFENWYTERYSGE